VTVNNENRYQHEPEGELSEAEKQDISEKLHEIESDFKDMLADLDPICEKRLKELAGEHYEIMQTSYEGVVQYLNDPDPNLREAAVQMAVEVWSAGQSLSSTFEKMAISDPSAEVRDSAARALGNSYARTKDRRIGHLLASIIFDEQADDGLRLTAFMSLIRLNGIMDFGDASPSSPLVPSSLAEIDWDFAKRYYEGDAGK
jgi:hypothetical protein